MKGVNELRALDDYLDPWQVFDIIGGTSTGGYAVLHSCTLTVVLYY
jgi:hypothetical protein